MGWVEMGRDGMGCDGLRLWDGMGSMGWDGMG